MKRNNFILCVLMVLLVIFITSCDEKTTDPGDEISISLSQTSGTPGEILTLTTNNELQDLEDYLLHFGSEISPILQTSDEFSYDVVVPVLSSGSADVYLENTQNETESNTISFNVQALPQTGLPAGEVTTEFFNLQKESTEILIDVVIPNLNIVGDLNDDNLQLMSDELNVAMGYFDLLEQEIQTLSDEDKELFDQLLYSSGLYDIFQRSHNELQLLTNDRSMYSGHHLCAAMDGFSSILTFAKRTLTLGGVIATIGSGGSLGPLFVVGVLVITTIDNGIDGFLPTDLDELYIEHDGDIIVPLTGSKQISIMGRFVPQSNPINVTIDEFVAAITGLGIQGFEGFIISTITNMGINIGNNLSNLTTNWQTINYVDHRIDPTYYEDGLGTFLTILGEYVGITITSGTLLDFLENISGLDYHIENSNIASFDGENSSIYGLQTGQSELIYNGYRFKGFDGWAGIISGILGLEWPQSLDSDQIEECNFTVQEFNETFISIVSNPVGASVYLDGTNMNATTPVVLEDIQPGYHHVRLFKFGYSEYNTYFTLANGIPYFIDADLGAPLPPLPIFTIYQPSNGATFYDNIITVSGLIQLEDVYGNVTSFLGDQAILTLNGVDQEIIVSNGSFNETISISSGQNTLQLRANSPNGDTGSSDEITIYGNFTAADIEVTLTWNTPTSDLDLHIWNPYGEHCYYGHMNITEGSLDIDDVEGYGPETFTALNALNGTYTVKVNCYSLDSDDFSDATIQVNLSGNNNTYGPHHFVVGDYNGNNPDAWWEVTTFTMRNGRISETNEPISESVRLNIEEDMRNLKIKSH